MPTFAVTPVIDYEPPTGNPPRCRVAPQVPPRPSLPHTPALGGAAQAAAPLSPQMREAAVFADAALRRVLKSSTAGARPYNCVRCWPRNWWTPCSR